MPTPPPPEELARRNDAMGPVANIKGPLDSMTKDVVASALRGEAHHVETIEVDHFRMQTIDVGPGRRVILYEIEYVFEEKEAT